jgi:DNA-binding SARP family transcriptional activator/tetratricopeptide (TPR) repeat protein
LDGVEGVQREAPVAVDRGAALRVHLLGRFEVARSDAPVPPDRWRRRRPADLLKLLALAPGHALARDRVIDALWPDKDPASGANNLHRALYDLRQIIGGRFVDVDEGRVRIRPGTWVDVDAFEAALDRADPASVRAAMALYRGDLSPEDPASPWLVARRQALRRRFARAAWPLARELAGAGDAAAALPLLHRTLEIEPANEAAWRLLLRLLAENGRRAEAIRQYDACEAALRAVGGPSQETRGLVEAIQRGEVARPRAPEPWDGFRSLARRFCGSPEAAPLRGRGAGLVLLESLLERGHGALVLLGEPGVGKSRLALEGARLAQQRGAVVLGGTSGTRPGSVLRSAISAYARSQGLPEADPFLAAVEASPAGSPEEWRRLLFESVPRLLAAVGAGRAVYLLAEDVHLADESSLNLLHLLAGSAARLRLAIVATCRDDEVLSGTPVQTFLAHLDCAHLARGVRLPRLPLAATREILADHLGADPAEGLLVPVHRATDGNPFHVEHAARAFRELGRIELTESPEAAVQARLQRLPPRTQEVLSTGAALGLRFDFELLRSACRLSGRELLAALEEAQEGAFVLDDGSGFRFRHSLVREAAYGRLPPERRRELHRALAEAVEARAAETGARDEWLEALATHRRAAEQFEEAVGPLVALGQLALARGALAEAVRCLAGAVDAAEAARVGAPQRLDLLEWLGRSQLALGELAGALRSFREAGGPDPRSGVRVGGEPRARLRRLEGLVHVAAGRPEEARALLEETAGTEAADLGAERAEALRLLSRLAWHRGDRAAAAALEARFREEAALHGEEPAGPGAGPPGPAASGPVPSGPAPDPAPRPPDPFDVELALWERDLLLDLPPAEVAAGARAAGQAARARGDATAAAVARAVEGAAALAGGRTDLAEEPLREAVAALQGTSAALAAAFARERLGALLGARGRHDEALAALGEGLLAAERAGLRWHALTRLHAAIAASRLAAGAVHAAEDAAREASESMARHGPCVTCLAGLHPVAARVALAGGRPEAAEAEVRALEALAAAHPAPGLAARAAWARACSLAAAGPGRADEARRAEARARGASTDAGAPPLDSW